MGEIHLRETELACANTNGASEHLRWCARCRSAAAEYRWLGERIGDTLTTAVDAVDVPRPKWRAVKRRMAVDQRRRVAGWRASATVGVALAICTILSLSTLVGVTAATQTSSLEAVMTPASLSATIFSERSPTRATATPTFPAASETTLLSSVPAPALAPLPTPPEPDI